MNLKDLKKIIDSYNILFDKDGNAVAVITSDNSSLYSFKGIPMAFIANNILYSYEGEHLGFFKDGWLIDKEGHYLLFTTESKGGLIKPTTKIPPTLEIKSYPKIRPINQISQIMPIVQTTWSTVKLSELFK